MTDNYQAVEAALQRVCVAYKATHFDNELRGTVLGTLRTELRANLPRPLEVAAPVGDALEEMRARKDSAYLERNRLVAALAWCYPSGLAKTAIEGWSEDWHGCVYIDLPTGQVSWHFHDSQAYLFDGLPAYAGTWAGHDTPEKYRRLAASRVPVALGAMNNELGNLIACFDAAFAEGLNQVLAETADERLKDLVERRLIYGYHEAIGPSPAAQPILAQDADNAG